MRNIFFKFKLNIVVILLISLFVVLTGCSNKTKDYGKFYGLKDAYENEILTYEDLLSIAYYNNDGISGNERVMSSDFKPKSIDVTLSDQLIHKIKSTIAKSSKEYDAYSVYAFYGIYHDVVVLKLSSSLESIPAVETEEYIEDIHFIYPTYSITVFVEN